MEFFNTHIAPEAITNVELVLKSGWLNEGKYVKEFEEKLAKDWGFANPLTLNSCTSALHLSLLVAGVGPGDEVIIPAQTFIATGTSVLMAGAKPVFADIDPRTGNLNPEGLEQKISRRTKAIIAVHWGGLPCDMDAIQEVADRHGLEVIEDAAHAFGAKIGDRPIGSISKFTCFSFQAIKFLTTGDGGAICTPDQNVYEELKRRKWFGFDKTTLKRRFEGDRECEVDELGFKYHMNDVSAAIGLGNLEDAKERLERRRLNAEYFREYFYGLPVPGVTLIEIKPDQQHAYWLFTMLVERRADFIQHMKNHNIPVSVVDRRIDAHPIFGGRTEGLIGQEEFDARQISIPVHEALSREDYMHIAHTVAKGW